MAVAEDFANLRKETSTPIQFYEHERVRRINLQPWLDASVTGHLLLCRLIGFGLLVMALLWFLVVRAN